MKRTVDEFMQIINEAEMSDDVKIALMEDITDSFTEPDVSEYTAKIDELTAEIETLTAKVSEVTEKYKQRFLESKSDEPDVPEEIEEDDIIDIKEI